VCLAAAACAALPTSTSSAGPLHISNASLFAHRAITHSLAFAVLGALLATRFFFGWYRVGAVARPHYVDPFLALLSHACLDALTTYPWASNSSRVFQQRFRFLWTRWGARTGRAADG